MKTNPNDLCQSEITSFENDKVIRSGKGLTKKEYFASMAMAKMAEVNFNDAHPIEVAEKAVRFADALIAELNKEQK